MVSISKKILRGKVDLKDRQKSQIAQQVLSVQD